MPADDMIVSAPPTPSIVARGKLGDALIVEATCDKYIEHQSIERPCLRFARDGVEIAPQTLGPSRQHEAETRWHSKASA